MSRPAFPILIAILVWVGLPAPTHAQIVPSELGTVWTDPDFDPSQPHFY